MDLVAQDRLLEPRELLARLEAEVLVQERPGAAIRGERIRLPLRPVEGEHQLLPEPLPERMLADERLELVDELGRAAEREIGLDPPLEREQPQLLEPLGVEPQRALVRELAERPAPPQGQRLAQALGGPRDRCPRSSASSPSRVSCSKTKESTTAGSAFTV